LKQNLEGNNRDHAPSPLWARARETKMENPIIRDEKALEMMEQIDYDFEKFERGRMPQVSMSIRTELLDKVTQYFIIRNEDGTIVNLGCGLDTRYSRLDNQKIYWYDLDLPEPIRIRRRFFKETERYKMIARSVFDYTWMDEIKTDKPILIIVGGVADVVPGR